MAAAPTMSQPGLLAEDELYRRLDRWTSVEHGSASPGERQVAEMLAAELRELGLDTRIEEEPAHGTYWWPIGLMTALSLVGAIVGRLFGVAAGVFAAKAVADDISLTGQWFRRRFLPMRTTSNVIAEVGPRDAARTLVFIAHHDAAHTGAVFDPRVPQAFGRRFPKQLEKTNTTPPTMWGAFFGPLLVALGSLFGVRGARIAGGLLSAGFTAAMIDIGRRGVVPGANDNLSGVAAQMSLAKALAEDPPRDLRVILLFPGSEESFEEGMQGWAARHFGELPRESTTFVCLDTVGSPTLMLLEGEGMLGIFEYPKGLKRLIHAVAEDEGIELVANLRFRNATDGLVPLKAGYPTAMIGSIDEFKAPANYHWHTDTAENVDYGTVAECARLCLALTRRLD